MPGLGVGRQERPGHVELTASIRRRVDARPTYGYRRINALLKRERRADGLAPVNAKRIYRLTRKHDLLLQRHTVRRRLRAEDGQVITIRSNCRWCSDAFEFTCWNGEVVRVAFARDRRDYVRGPDPGRRCSLCTRAIAGWRTTTPFSRTPDWATGHRASTFFPNPTRVRLTGSTPPLNKSHLGSARGRMHLSKRVRLLRTDDERLLHIADGNHWLPSGQWPAALFQTRQRRPALQQLGTGPHWPLAWARIVRCVPTSALPEGRVRMLGWRRRSRSGYTTQRHARHRAYSRGGHWRIIRCRVGPGTSNSRRLTPIFVRVAPPGSNCRDCPFPNYRPRRRRASYIAPIQKCQVGAADRAVLRNIKPITAPNVAGGLLTNLHWALRAREVRPPHRRIPAITRFHTCDSVRDALQILARRISFCRNAPRHPGQIQTRAKEQCRRNTPADLLLGIHLFPTVNF